jgi:hypothetical protein
MSTGKDILLWHSYHKPDALKFWAHNWSLPPEIYPMLINAQITVRTIWIGKKVTTRNINTCLDCWYMAYNRAIMMTWMKYQSSEYHCDMSYYSSPPSMAPTMTSIQFTTKYRMVPVNAISGDFESMFEQTHNWYNH